MFTTVNTVYSYAEKGHSVIGPFQNAAYLRED